MSEKTARANSSAEFLRGMTGDADARRVAIRDGLRANPPGAWADTPCGIALARALDMPKAKREQAMLSLLESVRQRALSSVAQERRSSLLDLLFLLTWEDWPHGAEWRARLVQLLIAIGPRLVSRPGPKRCSATAERYADVARQYSALASRGIRGQRRLDALVEMFSVSDRTVAKAVAKSRKR